MRQFGSERSYTLLEASLLLKTSVESVRRLIDEGQMPRSTYSNVMAGDIGHVLNALREST
jgi:hypothetical protein